MTDQRKLSDVMVIDGDEFKPRRHWKDAFGTAFETPAPKPSYLDYLQFCSMSGTQPDPQEWARLHFDLCDEGPSNG